MNLRQYQADAIQSLRLALAGLVLRLMLYSPTGSGKTEIAMAIIRSAIAKGKRVAFVANRIGLVAQTSRRLHAAGIGHGIIQADNTRSLEAQVLVCSIQTLAKRGLPPADLVIIDEAHACAGSADYRRLIFLHSAIPIIGLSETPFARGLGKEYPELGSSPLFQKLVVAATIRELIDLEFLVDVEIYAPSEPDLSGVTMQRNSFGEQDYSEAALATAVDKPNLIGDIVAHWLRLAGGKPTVCFASSIAHSKHITEQFIAAGVAAEHLDCRTSEDDRKEILGRVERGVTKVVSNVAILTEGWDFPACEVMILARPTRSLTRWVQMVGRILRPHPGKVRGTVLDHSGSSRHLGYPTDDLPLELHDGRPTKAGKAETASKESLPKKCPACSFMKPAKAHVCPKCGFAPERQTDIEVGAGELVQVKRKGVVTKDAKQHTYSQLLFVGRHRGCQPGWVKHKYRAMFGVWPK